MFQGINSIIPENTTCIFCFKLYERRTLMWIQKELLLFIIQNISRNIPKEGNIWIYMWDKYNGPKIYNQHHICFFFSFHFVFVPLTLYHARSNKYTPLRIQKKRRQDFYHSFLCYFNSYPSKRVMLAWQLTTIKIFYT